MAETIEKLLQQGFEFHQLGQAEFASQIYKAILLAEPNHPEASYNMGLLAVSAGQIEAGLTFLETALEANADNAIYWVSYIDVLLEIGRTEDAQAVFDQAKFNGAKGEGFDKLEQRLTDGRKETLTANSPGLEEKHPKQPNILNSLKLDQAINLAKKKAKEGAPEEAKRIFEDILTKFPKNKRASDGLKGLAGRPVGKLSTVQEPPQAQTQALINLYSQGQLQRALQEAETLAQKFPQSAILLNIKGAVLRDLGQFDASVEAYNKSLAIKPDHAEAYYNMGNAIKVQGKLEEAIKAYNKALAIKPDYAEAHYSMGVTLQDQGKLEEAIEAYNKSLAIKPDYAEAYYNMGNALKVQGKLEEAIEAYNKVLAIKPDYAEAHHNMGVTLQEQGKLEEAIEAYNKSLAIKPDYAEAHHNMSYACLAVKNFEQGFEKHEWRWKTKQFKTRYLKTKKPTWSGETKQRVLVWAEQGIGDEIIYSSIIPEIYATSSKVLVKCDKRLIPLFERSFSDDITYYSRDANVSEDEYDFHIPMGSLPLTFRKSLDSFKNSASGFLKCDMARAERIKGQLSHETGKKLVGISWKTKSPLRNSSTRNINLADLARALDNSKTQLVCLQYGDVSDEIAAVKRDFGIDVVQFDKVDNKYDLDGLASLILACDQIVSTTNVTVHLAGALGVKVTALLPFAPRWIWGDGSESFLYESVIPIKQKYHHNWNNVLESLRSNSYNLF